MKVLIVAKTRMHRGEYCVGGLAQKGYYNVRLLTDRRENQPWDTRFEVGDIWDLEFQPLKKPEPPHIEDVTVTSRIKLSHIDNIREVVLKRAPVWRGDIASVFDRQLQFTPGGAGYVSLQSRHGMPKGSVGFWLTDTELTLKSEEREGKTKHVYHTVDAEKNARHLPYVGLNEPQPILEPGTLLRVSLARWWTPDLRVEERCYLQLSGWYE